MLAYTLLFALKRESKEDFADRAWGAERARGLAAGEDEDGDGKVSGKERIKESAEWVNSVLRGLWSIINPDLCARTQIDLAQSN
jgi:hypothetical protein